MTELEDIILTIDTREQNQTRIKAVEDWFTGHKAVVEHSALKHCDYRLIGEFRGISVNLGVEAKGWDNFLSDDITEMEEKLLKATGEYDHVGFFVETQNYSFVPDENNKHGKLNYSIPRLNKKLPAKTLAVFEGFLDTVSKHPQIHVRQLRSEAQFPYSLYDLLVYLQKPHTLTIKPEGYVPSLQNSYMQIPQVGVERAKKLIQHYPNLFWLCSAAEESLISVMGKSQGTIIYQYLHNTELQTPEWMAGHHLDGTEKDESEKFICSACGLDKCTCVPNFDKPKLKKLDDEGRLAFDAPAKNPNMFECGISDNKKCSTCPKFNDINSCGYQIPKKKCDFADSKNRAECKTPDHFKQHSKIPSHAEGTILSNHNPPLSSADTSSHPSSFLKSLPRPQKLDDPQKPPMAEVKQESSLSFSPAEINIELDDKPLECIVKCRACHQVIIPEHDDDTGFCHDPKCIEERVKPKQRMNLKETIKDFMKDNEPHLLQEIVDHCEGWTPGNVYEHVMGAVKSGYFKKVTEQDGRVITFQRIEEKI